MLHKKNNLVSNNLEIGLDEAGRGPLIGRVYAGAVVWSDNNFTLNIKEKIIGVARKIKIEETKQKDK